MEAEKEGLKHPEAFKDQPDVSRQASTATANGTAANGDTKSLVVGNQAANGYSAVAGSEQDADDQQEQGQVSRQETAWVVGLRWMSQCGHECGEQHPVGR